MIRCSGCGQSGRSHIHRSPLFHGVCRVLVNRAIRIVEADDSNVTLANGGTGDGDCTSAILSRIEVGSAALGLDCVEPGDLLVNDVGNLNVNLRDILTADEVDDHGVVAVILNGSLKSPFFLKKLF